ncbi:MAG: DUF234 domain-containing protein, partial [Thermoplasmatota archaeon]
NEVEFLMREEFREPMNYYTILKSISQGNTKFSEIQNDTGISKNNLTSYLSVLRNLHLIKRRTPITKKNSNKGRYYLEDNFFKFWFKFIFPNKSQLETNNKVLLKNIYDSLDHYVSYIFEDICRELITILHPGFEFGRWWFREHEIDIVGLNEEENNIILSECKWTKNRIGFTLLNDLKEKADKVRWNNEDRKENYILFSKSGFTKDLKKYEGENNDVTLYSLEAMDEEF